MAQVTRVYETPEQAKQVAARLLAEGFSDSTVALIEPPPNATAEGVAATLAAKGVGRAFSAKAAPLIASGAVAVSVAAPFGWAARAEQVLGGAGPIPIGEPDMDPPTGAAAWGSPAPVSTVAARSGVSRPGPVVRVTTLPAEQVAIEHDPAPLSRRFGWPVLVHSAASQDGETISEPAPLSAKFGWAVLSPKKPSIELLPSDWSLSSRFGFSLLSAEAAQTSKTVLSDDPAPLSTKFGWRTLLDEATPLSDKAGWKTLLNDPAPLSRLLGFKVLSDDVPGSVSAPAPAHAPAPVAQLDAPAPETPVVASSDAHANGNGEAKAKRARARKKDAGESEN